MKKIYFSLLLLFLYVSIDAQQTDFEGAIMYRSDVKSKVKWASNMTYKTMLGLGDSLTVYIKQGNYRRSSGVTEEYYIPQKQKAYIWFKGIDTLFYRNYSSDTSAVIDIKKTEDRKTIAGLECRPIIIKTATSTNTYFYAPALYMNPQYDQDNKIGRYDVYTKETSSLYLSLQQETPYYNVSLVGIRTEQRKIDDSVFELPKLPEREFTMNSIVKPATFTGTGGWIKYLESNLNADLGVKYLKIPKGENDVKQAVKVGFIVTERGEVMDAEVLNKNEVHSKLAAEALRVVTQSHGWKPATMLGQKVPYWLIQSIAFYVTK
jgi:hypothetical protein